MDLDALPVEAIPRLRAYQRERLKEEALAAAVKEPRERTQKDWTLLAYSPAPLGHAASCGKC